MSLGWDSPHRLAAGTVTCKVLPSAALRTKMDTRVTVRLVAQHSKKQALTYAVVPDVQQVRSQRGRRDRQQAAGNFAYTPGFYPPDPVTDKRDVSPITRGRTRSRVRARAKGRGEAHVTDPITVVAPPHTCDPKFASRRHDVQRPTGAEAKQYRCSSYLIKMIDCTPPKNPNGTRATFGRASIP